MTKWVSTVVVCVLGLMLGLSVFWSFEPDVMDIKQVAIDDAAKKNEKVVTGYTTTTALIKVSEGLLNKHGGFLSNDVTPPSFFMDNMPSWEFGALEMSRDLMLTMRNDFSRSQSQSAANPQLQTAHPKFNIDHRKWIFPSAESEYQKGIEQLYLYRAALSSGSNVDAQFYARADNLRYWLKEVEKRLGSLSRGLSESVGQERINIDLAGDSHATQSTPAPQEQMVKTSFWKIDDVFYEARGASWALLHFLKAIEVDFEDVLKKKNAQASVKQIIRDLEATQQTIWSPMILNGTGFGVMANHSLVMANYISRANAAIIDLNELLSQG